MHHRPHSVLFARLAVLVLAALLPLAGCGEPDAPPANRAVQTVAGPQPIGGYRTRDLPSFGKDQTAPVELAPGVYQAWGVGNAAMVVTSEGNVVIDTGLPDDSPGMRERLNQVSANPVHTLVLTHAHLDHYGGYPDFTDEGTEVIAHVGFPEAQRYLTELVPFFMRRNRVFYPDDVPDIDTVGVRFVVERMWPQITPTRLVGDETTLVIGGERFVILHTPSAEGEENICVWMPDRKILFTGDFFGPLFPMFPNLYTIRGEKFRPAIPYIASLDRLIALEPEMLVPSHFEAIRGKETIRREMTKIRDAVQYVHDATVAGMNDDKSVYQLMREIELPPELDLSEGHGKVSWSVRGIWEYYSGFFHFRSTTELYGSPPHSVHPELVEMAGGADAVAARAAARLEADEPLAALHLSDMVLVTESDNRPARQVRLAALERMLELSGDENHSEVLWLESRIRQTREQLGE